MASEMKLAMQCPGCWSVSYNEPKNGWECECGEKLTVIDLRDSGNGIGAKITHDRGNLDHIQREAQRLEECLLACMMLLHPNGEYHPKDRLGFVALWNDQLLPALWAAKRAGLRINEHWAQPIHADDYSAHPERTP